MKVSFARTSFARKSKGHHRAAIEFVGEGGSASQGKLRAEMGDHTYDTVIERTEMEGSFSAFREAVEFTLPL